MNAATMSFVRGVGWLRASITGRGSGARAQEHQLADLDFGAEPSRRAGGQPGGGPSARELLNA